MNYLQFLEPKARRNASVWHAVHQRPTATQTKQSQIGQLGKNNQLMRFEPGAVLQP